jgi:hypothetical protein
MALGRAFRGLAGVVAAAGLWPAGAAGQEPRLLDQDAVAKLLNEKAALSMSFPEGGYLLEKEAFQGDPTQGSLWVDRQKMTYYMVHWGPIETETITPEYVTARIPTVWPTEGLVVQRTEPATVAGHPAVYAEVLPKRAFYRAHFLIWNCPESGRQLIADMNYNVSLRTPRSDLQAQIDATTKTLSCHDGAPVSRVDGLDARFESPRFRLGFAHPLRWYVIENPFGVPHPAYHGVRSAEVGSLLCWPKDRSVRVGVFWRPLPKEGSKERAQMLAGGSGTDRGALAFAKEISEFASFDPQATEIVSVDGIKAFKVLGDVVRKEPPAADSGDEAEGRALVIALDQEPTERRLFLVVWIDRYRRDGIAYPPDRDIFDRWGLALLSGLES